MKKHYIAPCTLCTEINTADLICNSPLGYGGTASSSRSVLSRDRKDNDDDDLW